MDTMMQNKKYYFSKRMPRKCPYCGSHRIATIAYGYPPMNDQEFVDDLYSGKIALGGCCITGRDPTWRCIDCFSDIYRETLREYFEEKGGNEEE